MPEKLFSPVVVHGYTYTITELKCELIILQRSTGMVEKAESARDEA